MTRIKVGEETYRLAAWDELSIGDIVSFDDQCANAGLPFTWTKVRGVLSLLSELEEQAGEDEAKFSTLVEDYPTEAALQTLVLAWISCRAAKDRRSIGEIADLPPSAITIIPDPQDHKGKAPGAKKPRKASAPADEPPVAAVAAAS